MKNAKVKIIAGPDSVDENNLSEISEIASIEVDGKKAIWGTRVVGIKSRSVIDHTGTGMGIDMPVILKNIDLLRSGKGYNIDDLQQLPSVEMAVKIVKETGMLVSTEVDLPAMLMPLLQKAGFPEDKLFVWNPAVDQLGWHVYELANVAGKNGWIVGLKNPKWLGESAAVAEKVDFTGETSLEKAWKGMVSYAAAAKSIIMIQRGVDVDNKGDFRNVPIHNTAARVKRDLIRSGKNVEMFFDPSHSYGPKMREHIPQAVIDCLKMKISDDEYLYDGILIEAGTAECDAEQHITIDELQWIVAEVSLFRELQVR